MRNANNRQFGSDGEKIALEHLANNGYEVIDKNYRIGKIGEIDIIARKEEFLCFVEVKTRSSDLFGSPSEAVTWKKQLTIRKLAQLYVASKKLGNENLRFDIVEIKVQKSNNMFTVKNINVIENAF